MNKNSRAIRKICAKNYRKNQNMTTFEIPKTMPGSTTLGKRTQTIIIGECKRKSKNCKVAGRFHTTVEKN